MNSNMTLTVLNLHQKTPKGATTKIQVKRYERYKRDKTVSHIPVERYKATAAAVISHLRISNNGELKEI